MTEAPPITSAVAATLSDDTLLAMQRELAEERRRVDAQAAIVAAEIKRRSSLELGYDGLAQRRGARTAEILVQQVTGFGSGDARALVRAGALMGPDAPVWLRRVGTAVQAADISVDAATAIAAGLGEPNADVSPDALADAAARLAAEARHLPPEKIAVLARRARTDLDEAGIADREAQRRQRRYLTLTPQPDGMTRISGLLDPESAAIVVSAVDAVTAPRRGGPRFVDPERAARDQVIVDDDRTTVQIALDALVEMVRIAGLADTGRLFGGRRIGVRLHVAERDLLAGSGPAFIEGQSEAVSIQTARRNICESGTTPVLFDDSGQPMNLGRTRRTFTDAQRIALAARDGGCRAPSCDRPPSWTEAHHIDEWDHDHGNTDIADGILLCRHHHMLIHNNGWRIRRNGDHYWMEHPDGRRIDLPTKNPIRERVLAR